MYSAAIVMENAGYISNPSFHRTLNQIYEKCYLGTDLRVNPLVPLVSSKLIVFCFCGAFAIIANYALIFFLPETYLSDIISLYNIRAENFLISTILKFSAQMIQYENCQLVVQN